MPQDAFTLNYLAQELNLLLNNGKINKIIAPNNDQVVLTVYNGKKTYRLLIDVNPSCPRIGIINEEKNSPLTASNFCMLLRKHLLNATINGISIVGFDRIIKIDLTSSSEFFDGENKVLFVELMGRYSNIILTQNNIVLGGNRGVNMFDDGVRPLIVSLPYVFPPTNDKILPKDEKLVDLLLNKELAILPEFISKNVQGIATSTASKLVNDFILKFGDINLSTRENCLKFFSFFNDFLFNSKIKPVVSKKDNDICDVFVFPYSKDDDIIEFDNLYSAEEYYFSHRERIKTFNEKKNRALAVVNSNLKKAKKRYSTILARYNDCLNYEQNKLFGELLIANLYRLSDGEKAVVENYYDDYKQIEIALDKQLSVKQNAENYFKKYNKQKRSLTLTYPQLNSAKEDIEYFDSLISLIDSCDCIEDIDLVISELEDGGYIKKQANFVKKKQIENQYRLYDVFGYVVKAGRNNIENDKLTFSSRKENLWVHAKDYHSSHIIIESEGKEVPQKVLITACEICAYYSKGRSGEKVEIVVTERKNVKKPSKAKLGFVTYSNFKSYMVKAEKHENMIKN